MKITNWIIGFTNEIKTINRFLWWKNYFDVKGRHIEGYQAQGNGGQMVFVLPDFDMIVFFTAENYSNPRMINAFKILKQDILPSLF